MLESGIYDFVICCGGTDMCFVLGFGRKRPNLKQYRISGLTVPLHTHDHQLLPLISTPFKGCQRGCSPQLLPNSRSSPRNLPTWVGYHCREPGRFTELDPDD